MRSTIFGKFDASCSVATTVPASLVENPAQSVAQKRTLCSSAIAWTLPAFTSLAVPRSPCP